MSVPPFARIRAHDILASLQSVFDIVAAVDGAFVVLAPSAGACRPVHGMSVDMKRAVPECRKGLWVAIMLLFGSRVR